MWVSSAIQDAQQRLLARGVLRYSPSLSADVHDALFSYWRLPLAVREPLSQRLPTIVLRFAGDDDTDASAAAYVSIDWEQVAACIQAPRPDDGGCEGNPMETTWAFALLAEAIVTKVTEVEATPVLTFPDIAHGEQIPNLLRLLRGGSGEFYMAFLVSITILERALYDLHQQHDQQQTPDTEPLPPAPPATKKRKSARPSESSDPPAKKKKKKNMILRDLLHSETLARALPAGLLLLLKILFLPSGLNLRNLVWHGFVAPAEFPKCFGCLVAVLLLALPQFGSKVAENRDDERRGLPAEDSEEPLFNVHSYNDRFVLRDSALREQLNELFGKSADGLKLKELLASTGCDSEFIPRGRRNLVRKAFTALGEDSDELWFLFALLPVLEHALRVKFISVNQATFGISSEYGTAQIDAYYSTLDGFGQRDKHQVLLHSHVVLDSNDLVDRNTPAKLGSQLNELYTSLPSAALAVCLDLFMMSSGPNLRAKLCHGEADLSSLLLQQRSDAPGRCVSTATQLLLLAWISLCQSEDSSIDSSGSEGSSRTLAVPDLMSSLAVSRTFEKRYASSFHPLYQLRRALATVFTVGKEFRALRCQWTRFRLDVVENGASEPMVWVEFLNSLDSEAAGEVVSTVGVLEKASRVHEFRGLLQSRDSAFSWNAEFFQSTPAPALKIRAKGFPALLEQLHTKLSSALAQLRQHFQTSHDASNRTSAFIELLMSDSSAEEDRHNLADSIFEGETELNPATEAFLLALSDGDGLSVASCMMEIVASVYRSYTRFQTRVVELQLLILEGKARTNHRRSFLNSVFFLSVFESVQVLCLSLVEHQVLHLISLAEQQQQQQQQRQPRSSNAATSASVCRHARQFELLQRKLLQFTTAFEGCAGGSSDTAAQKSAEKALLLALQFLDSKAIKSILK